MGLKGMQVFVVVLGLIAMAVQFVGMLVPMWIRVNVEVGDTAVSTDIGIWMAKACVKTGTYSQEICASASMDQAMSSAPKNSGTKATEDVILRLKMLTLFGLIGGLCGLAAWIGYMKNSGPSRILVILSALAWVLSGTLAIAAGASALKDYSDMKNAMELPAIRDALQQHDTKVQILFPASTVISCVGGVLAFITALIVGCKLLKDEDENTNHSAPPNISYKA